MNNIEENKFRFALLKRSTNILERTKYDFEHYERERHILLAFTREANPNYLLWEHMVSDFESVIDLNQKVTNYSKNIKYFKELAHILKTQRTRENFETNNTYFFEISDNSNNTMKFITRISAENYIKNNADKFIPHPTIKLVKSNNMDINFLLSILEETF